ASPRFLDAARTDQALIGCDQRDIRIDEDEAVAGRHLDVEMQVIAGAGLRLAEIADLADDLALVNAAAAVQAVGVHLVRVHVQIAEADVLAGGVDDQKHRLAPGLAHDDAAARRHDIAVVRAAVGARRLRAPQWPQVLTLMAPSARALGHQEAAALAEIVAPRLLNKLLLGGAGVSAAAKHLRAGMDGRIGERETDLGIGRVVGPSAVTAEAAAPRNAAGGMVTEPV